MSNLTTYFNCAFWGEERRGVKKVGEKFFCVINSF